MKNNLSTKIISLFFAIVLWFYIIQVQSPEVEKTIKGVPVLFAEKAELDKRNLMLVNDKDYTVDLRVRGQRKYLVDLDKTNLSVSADVGGIDTTGTHSVYTSVMIPYGNVEVLNQSPSNIIVSVDEIVEMEKEIKVETAGNPAGGFTVGTIKTTPATMKVRGAKSVVSGIDHVRATVDVSGKNEDISSVESIILVGTSGAEISETYAKVAQSKVDVHCEILKRKTVALEPIFIESAEDGSWYSLDENSVKSIEIAGAVSVVEKIERIQTKPITRAMIGDDDEVEVGLMLPTGVESLDGNKITLKLKRN